MRKLARKISFRRQMILWILILGVCIYGSVKVAYDIGYLYVENGVRVCISDFFMFSTAPVYADLRVFPILLLILILWEKNRQTYVYLYRYPSKKWLAGHILKCSLGKALVCSLTWTGTICLIAVTRHLPVNNWDDPWSMYAFITGNTIFYPYILPIVSLCVWDGVCKILFYELLYETLLRSTRYTVLVWIPVAVNAGVGSMMYLAKEQWFYIMYEESFWLSAGCQFAVLSAGCIAVYGVLYRAVCHGDAMI